MLYALAQGIEVDAFLVYTDNETWAGAVHPVQALKRYRQKTGIPAKLVVVGMTATAFSIADPNDAGMLDALSPLRLISSRYQEQSARPGNQSQGAHRGACRSSHRSCVAGGSKARAGDSSDGCRRENMIRDDLHEAAHAA